MAGRCYTRWMPQSLVDAVDAWWVFCISRWFHCDFLVNWIVSPICRRNADSYMFLDGTGFTYELIRGDVVTHPIFSFYHTSLPTLNPKFPLFRLLKVEKKKRCLSPGIRFGFGVACILVTYMVTSLRPPVIDHWSTVDPRSWHDPRLRSASLRESIEQRKRFLERFFAVSSENELHPVFVFFVEVFDEHAFS